MVVVIVAVLAALAIPKLITYIHSARVKSAAEQLYYDIETARSMAFQVGSSRVELNPPSTYRIYAPSTSTTPVKQVTLPSPITLSGTSNVFSFNRNKLPTSSGSIYISGYGNTYKIVIYKYSGRIRLEKN